MNLIRLIRFVYLGLSVGVMFLCLWGWFGGVVLVVVVVLVIGVKQSQLLV